jgi:hypothetical protein
MGYVVGITSSQGCNKVVSKASRLGGNDADKGIGRWTDWVAVLFVLDIFVARPRLGRTLPITLACTSVVSWLYLVPLQAIDVLRRRWSVLGKRILRI